MTDPHQLGGSTGADGGSRPVRGSRPAPLVPVTIVGGYLGAGKTTLINALLAGDHGRRLAVLVNDFGSVNIDADLITAHDGQTISLENGCVCCSIADAMGDALDRVLSLDPPPEQIIVEASGVADPAKVAIYGQGWPGCRLDAVVVLADATAVRAGADDRFVGGLIRRQLGAGDVVVLTKTDLIDGNQIATVQEWIATVAPDAEVLAVGPEADLSPLLLGHGGTGRAVREAAVIRRASGQPASIAPGFDADDVFVATVFATDRPVSEHELRRTLGALPSAVVRVKGLVRVASDSTTEPTAVIVHKVGDRLEIDPMADDADGTAAQLVMISIRDRHTAENRPFELGPPWRVVEGASTS